MEEVGVDMMADHEHEVDDRKGTQRLYILSLSFVMLPLSRNPMADL